MSAITIRDCKLITITEENNSFIIFIGASIKFMNNNAYMKSGKITSMITEGFYLDGEDYLITWDKISDIVEVDTEDVLMDFCS